jgi:exopolyphosphatase/pppGpp-phosphohydrolase
MRDLTPPLPAYALATGGTARALRRCWPTPLDALTLTAAAEELASLPVTTRARRAKVDLERAQTLPAGAIILAELQRLLRVPLAVAQGGVREGVCTRLLEVEAEAATG